MEKAFKIEWKNCPCGVCCRQYPANLGHFFNDSFYYGSGFDPHEVDLINAAFEALSLKNDAGSRVLTGNSVADDILKQSAGVDEAIADMTFRIKTAWDSDKKTYQDALDALTNYKKSGAPEEK